MDFNRAESDRIDLSAIDALPGLGGNQAFVFRAEVPVSDSTGQVCYQVSHKGVTVTAWDGYAQGNEAAGLFKKIVFAVFMAGAPT